MVVDWAADRSSAPGACFEVREADGRGAAGGCRVYCLHTVAYRSEGWCRGRSLPLLQRRAVTGTVCCRMLDSTHLEVVNLGDSGLRIIRDGKIVFATESLQHGFNMPFQLGSKEFIPYTDVPASALRDVVEVEAGDVVFMASDGFFDNVWDSELARLVKNSCLFDGYEKENCVEHMAESLAQAAAGNSKDTTLRTPWSVACAKNKDVGLLKKLFPQGGKVDDISVIVAQIEAPGDS